MSLSLISGLFALFQAILAAALGTLLFASDSLREDLDLRDLDDMDGDVDVLSARALLAIGFIGCAGSAWLLFLACVSAFA